MATKNRTPLKYLINPCDIDRAKVLAPVGDVLHKVWKAFIYGTECTCCLGSRLVVWSVIMYTLGHYLG